MEETTFKQFDPWGDPYGGIKYNGDPCFLVNSPRDYVHMRVLRFFLRLVSGWPVKELDEKLLFCEGKYHGLYNTCLCTTFLTLQTWYLIENATELSFLELGQMYVALLLNALSLIHNMGRTGITGQAIEIASRYYDRFHSAFMVDSRGILCLSKPYRELAVRFLTQTHVYFYKDKSDYSRKAYAKVHQIANWFSAYLIAIMLIALVLFNAVPPYLNYANGKFHNFDPANSSYELSLYIKLPLDPEKNLKMYFISLIINWYGSALCAFSIIVFDLFLSIMVFNLWGHFKILLHALDSFPKPAAMTSNDIGMSTMQKLTVMYSREEQEDISTKLKDSILYHRMIIEFINDMSQCFGVVLFVYYTFHQVSGCLMLLECSQGPEALARYLPLTIMMTAQLIQISIVFETIGSMSEKLRDEVYCLPWEYMNTKNRTTVLLFLINVQEPVHIKAGGLVDVGVTTMAGILKATLSYFAFLRTMA